MKILVTTLCIGNNFSNSGELSVRINNNYCKKNQYDFMVVRNSLDTSKTPHWTKILMIQQFLKMDYDAVFYIDADAIFTNHDKRIESIPNPNSQPITIANENRTFNERRGENTGTMLIYNCPESKEFLEYSMSLYERCKHSCVYEQEAIGLALEQKYGHLWNKLHCREMNSYHGNFANALNKPWNLWQEGDFVMHMLRENDANRMREFNRFI